MPLEARVQEALLVQNSSLMVEVRLQVGEY